MNASDRQQLLQALKPLVTQLEDDLRERVDDDAQLTADLTEQWTQLKAKGRTAESFLEWREAYLTQGAVAWVLTCVFVRYLEDNELLRQAFISGVGDTYDQSDDQRRAYFAQKPEDSDTDYLIWVFERLARAPAGDLFSQRRNMVHSLRVSGDGGRLLIGFFRRVDPESGALAHQFATDGGDTRFLGDLYQDLSEAARKRYALLQTPDFVEEFILDHTLEPAIEEFGLDTVRMIDPTCGSGHFLLGAFKRLFEQRLAARPGASRRVLVSETLEAVNGVDLNPFAVDIARFRLMIAALHALMDGRPLGLESAPALRLNVAVADSLIHGQRFERIVTKVSPNNRQLHMDRYRWDSDRYSPEDGPLAEQVLGRQYHAVVGNPPYIVVSDKSLNATYRSHYASASGKYSLVCPFVERFVELAVDLPQRAGFFGAIVSNAFTKRTFGRVLIEKILRQVDLTHVIDTAGAYIPGHGTPTIMLFGRNRTPDSAHLTAVLGIRGEPSTPTVPAIGKVWLSIAEHLAEGEFENEFVTVTQLSRAGFGSHPWSLKGGGAVDLKQTLEEAVVSKLGVIATAVGFDAIMGEDDVFLCPSASWCRRGVLPESTASFVEGAVIRGWGVQPELLALFPYNSGLEPALPESAAAYLWGYRTSLINRRQFGKNTLEAGLSWFEYRSFYKAKRYSPLFIPFAFVATHNHFVLDRGGKVFKQSAPVIKLPAEATVDDHLGLLGLLNSSAACFWMKMVFFNKGYGADSKGARQRDVPFEDFYEHDGTKIKQFPLPEGRPLALATRLDALGTQLSSLSPASLAESTTPTPDALDRARAESRTIRHGMIALQEELDWHCYGLYGLLEAPPLAPSFDDLPPVELGQRAFEIVLARKVAAGDVATTWFERHRSTPTTEIPAHWPGWYRDLVQQRIDLIERERFVRLIEQPEYKRRWQRAPWAEQEKAALESWLLDRLETPAYFPQADREGPGVSEPPRVRPVRELALQAAADTDFVQVAERYTGDPNVDIHRLVSKLVLGSAIPYLPVQRYKKAGLRKRRAWEETWRLQRLEDAIDARVEAQGGDKAEAEREKNAEVGDIPVPPKYKSGDFKRTAYWRLRGKLDVPKERFILYEGAEPNPEVGPVVGWAGWDHAQQAQALVSFYYEMKEVEGWEAERLLPLLAGLRELVPWVKQWHNDSSDGPGGGGEPLGDALEALVDHQVLELGFSAVEVETARIGA